LPPVEAPSARFILQLFLVPGILVAVLIGFIVLFFGGLGGGPRTPDDFLKGLRNPSELKRWKTAQDLAQILPRDAALRADVQFAYEVTQLLHEEMERKREELKRQREQPRPAAGESEEVPELLEYLPAVVGNFQVPVGLPLLQQLVTENADRVDEQYHRLRLRNAVLAIGMLGARVKELGPVGRYDALPLSLQELTGLLDQLNALAQQADSGDAGQQQLAAQGADDILKDLKARVERPPSGSPSPAAPVLLAELERYAGLPAGEKIAALRQALQGARTVAFLKEKAAQHLPGSPQHVWAQRAVDYLVYRELKAAAPAAGPFHEPYGVVGTLREGARAPDEMTRKFTVLALANWDEPGVEEQLRELCGDHSDIPADGFEDDNRQRGEREIRFNAALALARRGCPLTPWELVLETLDEAKLRTVYYPNPDTQAVAVDWVLKALRDLREFRQKDPQAFDRQTAVVAAVQKLTESDNVAIQVEAQKLLGGTPASAAVPVRVSREVLLIVAFGVGVLLLLAIAVIARWRRRPAPAEGPLVSP
jgi:hypothetical protein